MNDRYFDRRLRHLEMVSNRTGAVPALVIIQAADVLTAEQTFEMETARREGRQIVRVIGLNMGIDPDAM